MFMLGVLTCFFYLLITFFCFMYMFFTQEWYKSIKEIAWDSITWPKYFFIEDED